MVSAIGTDETNALSTDTFMGTIEKHPSAVSRSLGVGVAVLLGGYLLLTSTVTLHDTLWKFDVKRILELCLFPLIFAMVLFNQTLRVAFAQQLGRIPRWLLTLSLVLLGLGVMSSAYNATSTMSLLYSLAEVALLGLWVVAILAVAACRQTGGALFDRVAVVLLALVALAVGMQELLGVLAALSLGLEFHPRIALLHFSWPRFYNQVQTWSMPVIAALPLLFPAKPVAKIFCVAALALGWYVVIATGARGAALGIAGALLAAAIILPDIRKALVSWQLPGLIAALAIYTLVVVGHQQLMNGPTGATQELHQSPLSVAPPARPENNVTAIQELGDSTGQFAEPLTGQRMLTSSGRLAMWRGTLDETRTHPLLGIGPMNYACTGPLDRAGHPHNFPLQFMVEWGVPALLLLLFAAGFLLFKLASALRKPTAGFAQNVSLAACFAGGVVAATILACLDGVLTMPASQVTGVLVCGGLLGLLPVLPGGKPQSGIKASVVLTLALVVSIAFLAFARQELAIAAVRWDQTSLMDRGIPRLWQNGKVCRLYREQQNTDSSF